MIKLSNIRQTEIEGGIRMSCDVEMGGETRELWYDLGIPAHRISEFTLSPIPFLLGMLTPGMERREDVHIDAPMDAELMHRINHYLMPLQVEEIDTFELVKATATELVEPSRKKTKVKGALAGMSCGLDSLHTVLRYYHGDVPERYKLSSLVVFDVGDFFKARSGFKRTLPKSQQVADALGVDLFTVRTNLDVFYKLERTNNLALRHVAAAYCLGGYCDVYLQSAGGKYRTILQHSGEAFSTDPILLPLVSTPALEIFSAGADLGREEKTIEVLAESEFLDVIDLCTETDARRPEFKNCGRCGKCSRFLMVAEHLGQLDRLRKSFDVDIYLRQRFALFAQLGSGSREKHFSSLTDIHDYLKRNNAKIPFGAFALGYVHGWLRRIQKSF